MSKPIIEARNLGKKFRIGTKQSYYSLRDTMATAFSFKSKKKHASQGELWALKGLNFSVRRGEAVGIIGRNGAGKSTLLKVISQITPPTTGKITMRGRVASLLEVGTGFHPELTGRENIYLNGAILGMTRREIKSKFSQIVAFSEIEKFLDTPVKRYSSGMYVRLAFAVAAHLEPEILIVDEVLAVGDAGFQKKCLGKMEEVSAKEGRTVLFVSHNMQAINSLCRRCLLIDRGKVICDAPTDQAINAYNKLLREISTDSSAVLRDRRRRPATGHLYFTAASVEDASGQKRFSFEPGESVRFKISYEVKEKIDGLALAIGLRSGISREFVTTVRYVLSEKEITPGTRGTAVVELEKIPLRLGEYPLYFHLGSAKLKPACYDILDDILPPLIVTDKDYLEHPTFFKPYSVGYFALPSKLISHQFGKKRNGQKK